MSLIDTIKSKLHMSAKRGAPEPQEPQVVEEPPKYETLEDCIPAFPKGMAIMVKSEKGTRLFGYERNWNHDEIVTDCVFDKDGKMVGSLKNIDFIAPTGQGQFKDIPAMTDEQRKQYAELVDINMSGVQGTNGHSVVTDVSNRSANDIHELSLSDDGTLVADQPIEGSDGKIVNIYAKNKDSVMTKAEADIDAAKMPEQRLRDAGIILPEDGDVMYYS